MSERQRIAMYGEAGRNMSDREMLSKCLEQHKVLNRVCNELEEFLSIPILIQFVTSTSAICTASVAMKIEPSQFFKMLLYAVAHLAQLFYYCFVGDDLSYQSEELSLAIYECNWHLTYDRDFRKALVLMMQRSQRVQRLTAAGVASLDYASFVQGLVRLHIMMSKKDVINATLVKIWKQFWPLNVIEPIRRKKIQRKAQTAVLLTSIFLASSIISNSQITGAPFVRSRGMVLKSVFPFDWRKSYYYELVYVWHYYSDWYVLFVINAFDFFFIALVTICSVQFLIMQEVFRYILTEESREQRIVIFGERGKTMSDREMLLECLEQHKLVIGICNELEESFNIAILIQFFVSTSAICAASLVLSGHLGDVIYECNWHLSYDRDFRKAIVLMIQRSQRVQRLTAAGITELDFSSFLKIMRLSFSFYTLLNNLLAKNEGIK
ncbi:hypothetical protein Trydic_g14378 [Trypoxylus dichotomus]